jgi:hypothetical protein
METITEFGRITRPMLMSSFSDDFSATFKAEEEQLISLFRSSYPRGWRTEIRVRRASGPFLRTPV